MLSEEFADPCLERHYSGHTQAISLARFNPSGEKVVTCSLGEFNASVGFPLTFLLSFSMLLFYFSSTLSLTFANNNKNVGIGRYSIATLEPSFRSTFRLCFSNPVNRIVIY